MTKFLGVLFFLLSTAAFAAPSGLPTVETVYVDTFAIQSLGGMVGVSSTEILRSFDRAFNGYSANLAYNTYYNFVDGTPATTCKTAGGVNVISAGKYTASIRTKEICSDGSWIIILRGTSGPGAYPLWTTNTTIFNHDLYADIGLAAFGIWEREIAFAWNGTSWAMPGPMKSYLHSAWAAYQNFPQSTLYDGAVGAPAEFNIAQNLSFYGNGDLRQAHIANAIGEELHPRQVNAGVSVATFNLSSLPSISFGNHPLPNPPAAGFGGVDYAGGIAKGVLVRTNIHPEQQTTYSPYDSQLVRTRPIGGSEVQLSPGLAFNESRNRPTIVRDPKTGYYFMFVLKDDGFHKETGRTFRGMTFHGYAKPTPNAGFVSVFFSKDGLSWDSAGYLGFYTEWSTAGWSYVTAPYSLGATINPVTKDIVVTWGMGPVFEMGGGNVQTWGVDRPIPGSSPPNSTLLRDLLGVYGYVANPDYYSKTYGTVMTGYMPDTVGILAGTKPYVYNAVESTVDELTHGFSSVAPDVGCWRTPEESLYMYSWPEQTRYGCQVVYPDPQRWQVCVTTYRQPTATLPHNYGELYSGMTLYSTADNIFNDVCLRNTNTNWPVSISSGDQLTNMTYNGQPTKTNGAPVIAYVEAGTFEVKIMYLKSGCYARSGYCQGPGAGDWSDPLTVLDPEGGGKEPLRSATPVKVMYDEKNAAYYLFYSR